MARKKKLQRGSRIKAIHKALPGERVARHVEGIVDRAYGTHTAHFGEDIIEVEVTDADMKSLEEKMLWK